MHDEASTVQSAQLQSEHYSQHSTVQSAQYSQHRTVQSAHYMVLMLLDIEPGVKQTCILGFDVECRE